MEQKTGYPKLPAYSNEGSSAPIQSQLQPTTVQQTVVVQPIPVGPEPCRVTCPSCGAQIITKLKYESTSKTHLFALILCCCLCWLCSCIPYCMDSCRNGNHYCPNCNAFIGTYSS